MSVADIKQQIDREAALLFLRQITQGWEDLGEPVMLELRCLFPGKTPNYAHFSPDEAGLALAVDHAEAMNGFGLNIYPVINPVLKANIVAGNAAKDADIAAAFWHWADSDEEASTEALRSFAGPRPNMVVLTGSVPFPRPHAYWRIADGPITDLKAWRAVQEGIAATLDTDKTVVNASRIMRLPGMVNWPTKDKAEKKGRIPEIATMAVYEDREPVPFERMQRQFQGAVPAVSTSSTFSIDTGGFADTLDRERTRIQALDGVEWHNAVIKLVASYVSRGLSDAEIHGLTDPLTLPGYTVDDTRREVQTAIDGARRKGWTPEPAKTFEELTPEQEAEIPAFQFRPWSTIDLAQIPYPEFVYSDFYAKGYTSLTLAQPKVGKSMLGLAEALDMATGRGFLTGYERDPLRVVYYNAEDDQNVLNARVAALLTEYGIDQSEIDGRFWAHSGVDAVDFFLVQGMEGVINEPLFVALEKFCVEQRADVLIFDPLQDLSSSPETNEVFRLLGQRLRRMASTCGVSLGIIHHTRKVAPGMQAGIDDARGGSALRGTARFNRVLNPMTEDEAAKAGVDNHRFYFRIGDMESNLAPPSADVNRWFEKVSVPTPNGHHIGAVKSWQWPDAFEGITLQQVAHIRNAIDGMAEPPRVDVRAKNWVGEIVADVLGLNIAEKAKKERVKALVSGWIKTDVLRVAEHKDSRAGRTVNVVIAGANNPLVTGGQGA